MPHRGGHTKVRVHLGSSCALNRELLRKKLRSGSVTVVTGRMLSASNFARFVRQSLPRQFPICRGIAVGDFGQQAKYSTTLLGRLHHGQKLALGKPRLLPFLSAAKTGYSSTLCSTSPEWHRFLSSATESNETLNEYDIDTKEYVSLVASYLEEEAANMILIDVREPEELVESGQIPGTINIPRKV